MRLKCTVCGKGVKLGQGRKISVKQLEFYRNHKNHSTIDRDGTICNACRMKVYNIDRSIIKQSTCVPTPVAALNVEPNACDDEDDKDELVTIPTLSVSKSHSVCAICLTKNKNLICMGESVRLSVFINQGVLLEEGVRCCKKHLNGNHLKRDAIIDKSKLRKKHATIQTSQLVKLLENLRKSASVSTTRRLSFDDLEDYTDTDLLNLTGLKKHQFEELVEMVTTLKKSKLRSPRLAIGVLLVKLRTGLSQGFIGTLYGKKQRQISRYIKQARDAICSDFVPSYLGFHHISRNTIIEEHTTYYATQIFSHFLSDSVISIMDGTYIYIQKSHNYAFQRQCFSMHKHRPLVKPMVVTATDGYIISILGPFFANGRNNDASILKYMVKSNEENLLQWFKKDDILILDRGFRDSIEFLNDIGFCTKFPAFLGPKEKQFSAKEGNESRLVTKIRWAVESVNARLKTWKFLDKVVCNKDIPHLKKYINIVAAICNCFRAPLQQSSDNDCDIARKMVERSKMANLVQQEVESQGHLKKHLSHWQSIESIDFTFPRLGDDYLRSLTFGVYQLSQAPHYADQHLSDGDLDIRVNKASDEYIRGKIQSRHTSSKKYFLWIKINHDDPHDPIVGWYCECKAGARTVGCCAHIATIIWYLGNGKHSQYQPKLDILTPSVQDAAAIPEVEIDIKLID